VHLLDCAQWLERGQYLRAVRERDLARGRILAVDVGEPVRVKASPQPVVRAPPQLLCGGQPLGQHHILTEALHEQAGKLACRLGDREAHRAPVFRAAQPARAACERERPGRLHTDRTGRT
jgi:hypothetical protein